MLLAGPAMAQEPLRLAVLHTGLGRDGPGLLVRDIRRGDTDVLAIRDALVALSPDAILLMDIDHDRDDVALTAFAARMAEAGHPMPYALAPRPNTGMPTGLDLDGDGWRGTADDAQGWGRFSGAGGMALMSRLPIDGTTLRDHSAMLWRDLPGARLPRMDGRVFPADAVFAVQRLSSVGHWEVALRTPAGPVWLMAWHAGPPVFGGPHDRNRLRNAEETRFWTLRLNGFLGDVPEPFVLWGGANLDPEAGAGDRAIIAALLAHPRLQDPAPRAPLPSGGAPTAATGFWPDGPGALRVDYLLPSRDVRVVDSGLIWPTPQARHAIVWADLAF